MAINYIKIFSCSRYRIPREPEGGHKATKQNLPSIPSDYVEEPSSRPDNVDPVYEDLDNPNYNVQLPTQQSKDVATTDVKMDNPAYDTIVQSSSQKSKDITTNDVKMEDNPAYDTNVQASEQESKDITTKMDNNPACDTNIQSSEQEQESKDIITNDVKMEDTPV